MEPNEAPQCSQIACCVAQTRDVSQHTGHTQRDGCIHRIIKLGLSIDVQSVRIHVIKHDGRIHRMIKLGLRFIVQSLMRICSVVTADREVRRQDWLQARCDALCRLTTEFIILRRDKAIYIHSKFCHF